MAQTAETSDIENRLRDVDIFNRWKDGELQEPKVFRPSDLPCGSFPVGTEASATAGRESVIDFCLALLGRLPSGDLSVLLAYLAEPTITWCSLCAGADVPAFAIDCFVEAVGRLGVVLRMPESFSSELLERKRAFRRHAYTCMPDRMFGDMASLAKFDYAVDDISGNLREVPSTSGSITGFPCQDVSRCNRENSCSVENRNSVLKASLRTGAVFNYAVEMSLRWVTKHASPRRAGDEHVWQIYENVTDLGIVQTGE